MDTIGIDPGNPPGPLSEGVQPWIGEVSLLTMIEHHTSAYFWIAERLTHIDTVAKKVKTEEQDAMLDEGLRSSFRDRVVSGMRKHCATAGLDVSVRALDEFEKALDKPLRVREFREHIFVLRKMIRLELKSITVYQVDRGRMQFLAANEFEAPVLDGFSAALFDIGEAGKCFAYARNTACVFHLMRVMETGLRALSDHVNVPTRGPDRRDWDTILVQIESRIQNGTANAKFLVEVVAQLRAVKRAWRNNVMHVGSEYTDERARDIFTAVKGFMHHLATEIREP